MRTTITYTTALTVIPVREKADDASEMITQVLFGEEVSIIKQVKRNWVYIRGAYDGYEGYVDPKQLLPLEKGESRESVVLSLVEPIFGDGDSTYVTIGATLREYDGMVCSFSKKTFRYSGQAIDQSEFVVDGERVEKLSRMLLNVPYLWGGRTPFGIDCSGFTQLIFKCCGIPIKRDAKDQALQGEVVDFVSAAVRGDLAFFTTSSDRITHVGIILDDQKIIHASGKVRIDKLDHYGIFNEEIKEYTHRLKIIKRFF